jgi:3-isopropylmalate/(R)-2-methylmalate dehydratase large subunit
MTPSTNAKPKTLFDKIWDEHVVVQADESAPAVLYIDLHLLHEVTSPQAFDVLNNRGLPVRRPDRTIATMDHITPTLPPRPDGTLQIVDAIAANTMNKMIQNCETFGVPLYDMSSDRRGIVHVIGPELGLTQPGMTIVCGDSHTSTHGAFGALAFGIGTSEVGEVMATQCLLQRKPKTFEVNFEGKLQNGVTAKDLILALLAEIGIEGGTGHAIEYRGEVIRDMSMEGRMTVCNMSIEGGARAGMIAPDDTTIEYLAGREFAPQGDDWARAVERWRQLPTDEGATFDKSITLDASKLEPMITYGTNPSMGLPISAQVPDPDTVKDPGERRGLERAIEYMGLKPGQPMLDHPVDVIFIGSCTNSRLSDMREAAEVLRGRKVDESVRVLVVPGSHKVKAAAEAEGLDEVFQAAGAEWREPGCSMCIAMNGDQLEPGQVSISTSNRNFEGRQGKGGRTLLASPTTAAASAIKGAVADPRKL